MDQKHKGTALVKAPEIVQMLCLLLHNFLNEKHSKVCGRKSLFSLAVTQMAFCIEAKIKRQFSI